MMSLRQFQQATSMALEQKKYISALRNSVKAEKALKKFYKELFKVPSEKKISGMIQLSMTF
jgi:hypothetical protein